MTSSSSTQIYDVLDDVDGLLFLCDRLQTRLNQVTNYVDQVKNLWLSKRRSIEVESNVSPMLVQKASKCNKILLDVAEKLAIVELQTESLYNLQSALPRSADNLVQHGEVTSTTGTTDTALADLSKRNVVNRTNESTGSLLTLKRDTPFRPTAVKGSRLRMPLTPTSPYATSAMPSTNTDGTGNLSSNKSPMTRQLNNDSYSNSTVSAFNRPGSGLDLNSNFRNLTISPLLSQNMKNDHDLPSRNSNASGILSGIRPLPNSTPVTQRPSSIIQHHEIRVQMQVVRARTVWMRADIPIIDHPSAFFVFNQDQHVQEKFNKMSSEMNKQYNVESRTMNPLKNPSIGDFCVTRFAEDNQWYRARVVLVNVDSSILITFIDYGNSESKNSDEIFPLLESFTNLPAMAVACTLSMASPKQSEFWTQDDTNRFTAIVKDKSVQVEFVESSNEKWPLHFVNVTVDRQSVLEHPDFAPWARICSNSDIAAMFKSKLTAMELTLYNVAANPSDVFTGNL